MNTNILNYWVKYYILLIFNIYDNEFNINIYRMNRNILNYLFKYTNIVLYTK